MSEKREIIKINTEFIKLDAFLKFAAAVGSGGEAKTYIKEGLVTVNGEACSQRGKKLWDGDWVSLNDETFLVRYEKL